MRTFVPDGKIQDLEGNVINMASESGVMEDNASQSSRSSLQRDVSAPVRGSHLSGKSSGYF